MQYPNTDTNSDAIMIITYLSLFTADQSKYELKNSFLIDNIAIIHIYN